MRWLKKHTKLILFSIFLLFCSGSIAAAMEPALVKALEQSQEAYKGKDYAKVKSLLAPWAEKNEPTACFVMGLMLARGEGDARDLKAAEKWWIRSSEAGNALAQFNLGYLYFKGAIGPQDYTKARQYWTLSARQGHPDALYSLGMLQANGEGGPKDIQSGINNYKLAAEAGHPLAQYELGQAYLNGVGVKQDKKKAKELFAEAAARGMSEAKAALEALSGKAGDKSAKKNALKPPAKKTTRTD